MKHELTRSTGVHLFKLVFSEGHASVKYLNEGIVDSMTLNAPHSIPPLPGPLIHA